MGFFDFVASAGEKLAEKVKGDAAEPDITKSVEVSPQRLNELREKNIARMVAELDVDGEQVSVKVDGDLAVLTGSAPSQESLEKIVLCAGNQFGIARVDCQMTVTATAAAAAEPTAIPSADAPFYTVQAGDTLGKIAQAHYGSAGKYMAIFEANQPMLKDPNKIYPGQSLRIPKL